MTLPLNHSKDRVKLLEDYIAKLMLRAKRNKLTFEEFERRMVEFNTQSTDSGE